jgi:hypothetical protein
MLSEFADRDPTPHATIENVWVVAGLQDVLPDPDPELFENYKQLGIGMMEFYKTYAAKNDNFSVIAVEHEFSVPVFNPVTGDTMYAIDTRVMPKDWTPNEIHTAANHWVTDEQQACWKPVHARGRIDLVVQDLDSGQFGIMDHKTAGRVDDDYFRHLDLDDQVTTYAWAAEQEALLHDLEYKQIDFIIYQALRKAYPKPPTMLQSGKPSVDRQKESTTADLFEACIKENNLELVFNNSVQLQAYYTWLVEQGDKLFIQRDVIHRNKWQKAALGSRLYYEAEDMLDIVDKPEKHYPNPRKEYACLNCQFRAPCGAQEMGYDYEAMLADGYISNYDR